MSAFVTIELEFEEDQVGDEDVYDYLHQLMENDCLDWQILKSRNPIED
jgi:hypothetical protein